MEEPSVLDYLKSKLKFWERGEKIEIPMLEPAVPITEPDGSTGSPQGLQPDTAARAFAWPWRSLLALGLALMGQLFFEPPGRAAFAGIVIYIAAAGLLIWAYLRGEWTLTELPESESRLDPLTFRRVPMILAVLFTLAAFYFLSNNLFNLLNLMLWFAAIACYIWALWLKVPAAEPWWRKAWSWVTRREWNIKITGWTLLVLIVTALVIFFRVYHIAQTPAEPFSDHAEKILDVYDITQGQTHIFFTRNTGREGFQMYLTVVVAWLFQTGLSFLSLKIGTVLCGLATLPYMYLLGKEIGGKRVGLLAVLFFGIAYWPNVIARIGLRFPLYPLFTAPTLYYLIRGLRTQNRNDFILSGLFLGFGLHGYSPFRIVPILVVVAIGLYLLHRSAKGNRSQTIIWLSVLALASLIVFLPLLRYALDDPAQFGYRAFTRLGTMEQPLPDVWWKIFLSNLWNAARMFNWDDGQIWVNSVTHRPALDVVSAALFMFGIILLIVRYIRRRNWLDLFLILSIPVLQLPSSLSLAFPNENPALNRASGAAVVVFVIVALALDGLMTSIQNRRAQESDPKVDRRSTVLLWAVTGVLLLWSVAQNYDLVFKQYDETFRLASWNSSEMGAVIKQFGQTYGETDTVWIVPFPYWVDTRLPGVWAGIPNRDFAMWRDNLNQTLNVDGPKLFIVKADLNDPNQNDQVTLDILKQFYPQGSAGLHTSDEPGHDFWIFFVPTK
jgi:4-amino-4-deoxy-L-arabinose transferase-like glycosyltransferase